MRTRTIDGKRLFLNGSSSRFSPPLGTLTTVRHLLSLAACMYDDMVRSQRAAVVVLPEPLYRRIQRRLHRLISTARLGCVDQCGNPNQKMYSVKTPSYVSRGKFPQNQSLQQSITLAYVYVAQIFENRRAILPARVARLPQISGTTHDPLSLQTRSLVAGTIVHPSICVLVDRSTESQSVFDF